MRKWLKGICCAAMLISGCARAEEPVKLTVKVPVYLLEQVDGKDAGITMLGEMLRQAAQDYEGNAEIEVIQYPSEREKQELDDAFGKEDSPDIIFGDMKSYTHKGVVVPLSEIADEVKEDILQEAKEKAAHNGELYSLPFLSQDVVLCYNRELLNQAGIEMGTGIENWSLEKWEDVLRQLKEKLPASVYPMMMYGANEQGDMQIMNFFRMHGGGFHDGKSFRLNTDETVAAIETLQDWNEKGYFTPNAGNLVMMDNYDLFMNGQLVFYCANVALLNVYKEAGMDVGLVNFPGDWYTSQYYGFQVVDTGDEKKEKAAQDFLNWLYGSDWLDYSAGAIPTSQRIRNKYEGHMGLSDVFLANGGNPNTRLNICPNWTGVRSVFHTYVQELLDGKDAAQLASDMQEGLEKACAS